MLLALSLSLALVSTDPTTVLDDLAATAPARLGLGANDTLRDVRARPLRHGWIVRAGRAHQGVPVIAQSMALRLDEQGRVLRLRSDFTPLHLVGRPLVGAPEAVARAFVAVHGVALPLEVAPRELARLVIEPHAPSWAYEVVVPGLLPTGRRTVLVSAETGAVLEIKSPVRRAANDADVYASPPWPSPDDTLAAPERKSLARLDASGFASGT